MPRNDGNQTDTDNHGRKSSGRIFLTLEPEKRISKWLLGVGSAGNVVRTVKDFQDAMLHGDKKHQYWAASLPQKDRDLLAKRVRVEGFIYVGIGILFGGTSFLDSIHNGLSGHVLGGLFWLLMGFLASVMGIWTGTVKFWQAHNVQHGAHISLMEFMKLRKSPEGGGASGG
jgi:hypothetical protein